MVITYNLKDSLHVTTIYYLWLPLPPFILYEIVDFEISNEPISISGIHIIIPNQF